MEKVMNKKQVVSTICWIVVLFGVVYAYLSHHGEITTVIDYLKSVDLLTLLLLVPTIFAMWRAAGRIWHPYLESDGLSSGLLSRIQYEINFVDTVVPFFSIPGAVYALARLKKLGVSEGKASGMFVYRYLISISTKWIEIAIVMIIMAATGRIGEMPSWIVGTVCVFTVAIIALFAIGLLLFRAKARVPRALIQSQKFGKVAEGLQEQLDNLFETLDLVFSDKWAFLESFGYGLIYSLFEVLPFFVVAAAMGHPELLMPIIAASGLAILVGIVIPTPMGIGGLDGAMIVLLGCTAENVALATAIVLTTRVLVLGSSVITGFPFWAGGMRSIEGKN